MIAISKKQHFDLHKVALSLRLAAEMMHNTRHDTQADPKGCSAFLLLMSEIVEGVHAGATIVDAPNVKGPGETP